MRHTVLHSIRKHNNGVHVTEEQSGCYRHLHVTIGMTMNLYIVGSVEKHVLVMRHAHDDFIVVCTYVLANVNKVGY